MDYHIDQQSLTLNETIFEECKEQPVDVDFSLPDYCPDVQRILKCQIYPKISNCSVSADRFEVNGDAKITLLYLDSSKLTVRICEHAMPFACSFVLDQTPPGDITFFAWTKVEYVNCRAVSQRRLDIHGAFSVYAKIEQKQQQEIVVAIHGKGIEQKRVEAKTNQVSGTGMGQFSVNEVLEVDNEKPEIETIIRTEANVFLNDYKALANKVILKGEAIVRLLYMSDLDTGNLESMDYAVPISQIIDVTGATEECICDVKLDLVDYAIKPKSYGTGQESLLEVELKLMAVVVAYGEKEVKMVTDAYSTDYEIEPVYKNVELARLVDKIDDSYVDKSLIDINGSNISKVLDIWNEMSPLHIDIAKDEVVFKGKMNFCILALNAKEEQFYLEKAVDFEYIKNCENVEEFSCNADVKLVSLGYRTVDQDKIEVRFELKISACIYAKQRYKMISDLMIDKEKPKSKDGLVALTIYYADADEDIWDIARQYCTSVGKIKEQNDIQEDILQQRTMLLI